MNSTKQGGITVSHGPYKLPGTIFTVHDVDFAEAINYLNAAQAVPSATLNSSLWPPSTPEAIFYAILLLHIVNEAPSSSPRLIDVSRRYRTIVVSNVEMVLKIQ